MVRALALKWASERGKRRAVTICTSSSLRVIASIAEDVITPSSVPAITCRSAVATSVSPIAETPRPRSPSAGTAPGHAMPARPTPPCSRRRRRARQSRTATSPSLALEPERPERGRGDALARSSRLLEGEPTQRALAHLAVAQLCQDQPPEVFLVRRRLFQDVLGLEPFRDVDRIDRARGRLRAALEALEGRQRRRIVRRAAVSLDVVVPP